MEKREDDLRGLLSSEIEKNGYAFSRYSLRDTAPLSIDVFQPPTATGSHESFSSAHSVDFLGEIAKLFGESENARNKL